MAVARIVVEQWVVIGVAEDQIGLTHVPRLGVKAQHPPRARRCAPFIQLALGQQHWAGLGVCRSRSPENQVGQAEGKVRPERKAEYHVGSFPAGLMHLDRENIFPHDEVRARQFERCIIGQRLYVVCRRHTVADRRWRAGHAQSSGLDAVEVKHRAVVHQGTRSQTHPGGWTRPVEPRAEIPRDNALSGGIGQWQLRAFWHRQPVRRVVENAAALRPYAVGEIRASPTHAEIHAVSFIPPCIRHRDKKRRARVDGKRRIAAGGRTEFVADDEPIIARVRDRDEIQGERRIRPLRQGRNVLEPLKKIRRRTGYLRSKCNGITFVDRAARRLICDPHRASLR